MSATTVRPSAAPTGMGAVPGRVQEQAPWRPTAGGAVARLLVVTAILGTVAVLPLVVTPLTRNVVATIAVYGMVALSLNVLVGYTGQVSLGHSAFLGIGAFAAGFVLTELSMPWEVAAAAGVVLGATIALLLGVVALRVRGLYLALVTLALGLFAERVLFGIEPLTGGGAGQTADRPSWAAGDLAYAYVCYAGLALVWLLDWRLTASKAGRAIRALRDSERVAASWGIDVTRYKLLAFVISGAIAGLAGALFASITEIVSPLTFSFMLSLTFLMMVVVGGLGSRLGVVVGAALFTALPNVLDALGERYAAFPLDGSAAQVLGAALLLAVLVWFPGGIAGLLAPFVRWCTFKPFRSAAGSRVGGADTGGGDVRP
ncbi:branched-chain amino acid ABC transporter permease [Egicoccus sp. AB-alg6-2]|uniref:branched-chain amino acid ABC transporter permease n=1 Tax=Egicoccus sp. AB-alg6-2 TaxID=3242692 RepID=UPI00359DF77C